MKLVSFFLLFIVSNLFSQSLQQIYDQSVVQIVLRKPDKKISALGTGFFVNDSTIISANHVFAGAKNSMSTLRGGTILARKYSFNTEDKFIVPIKARQYHSTFDLVNFQINTADIKKQWSDFNILSLKLSDALPEVGMDAVGIGYYSNDKFPNMIKGIVSGFVKSKPQNITDLIFDKITNPGNSGGPLISLESKEIIGMLIISIPTPSKKKQGGLARAVTSLSIREFLKIK